MIITGMPPAGIAPGAEMGNQSAKTDDGDFGNRLANAIENINSVQHKADDKLAAMAAGQEVDLHGAMIALEEADITLRTMVTARDKVIEAYQQLMNMTI
jgi:flagellar hook-basal body complex protein FliE